jgi:chaperonin cofactor prefoldin
VFYKPVALREISDVLTELRVLENDADGMIAKITGGITDGE